MVTIIVAAHGESAPALLKTAGMILGNFENVHPVTFLPGQGPEDLVEEYTRIVEASEAEETLLLVDLFGGSPYNAGAQFAATREGVDVVSGVNVPMLIEVISGAGRKNATLKSLVAKAHKAGTKGIRSFQEANQPAAAKPDQGGRGSGCSAGSRRHHGRYLHPHRLPSDSRSGGRHLGSAYRTADLHRGIR